jgi:hypothetical protein
MNRRRAIAAALALAFAVGAISVYRHERAAQAPAPSSLLASEPPLPTSFDKQASGAAGPFDWRMQPGWTHTGGISGCPHGRGASDGWTNGGTALDDPSAWETICVYAFESLARYVYWRQSLLDVGGEDWQPNVDPSSADGHEPHPKLPVGPLHADTFEIGCGSGDPNGPCSVWTYRARYGRVTFATQVRTNNGAIPFEAMRRYVRAADSRIEIRLTPAR